MPLFLIPGPVNGVAPARKAVGVQTNGIFGMPALSNSTAGVTTSEFGGMCVTLDSEEFGKHIMGLRDEAVRLARSRLGELRLWNGEAKRRAKEWLNEDDDGTRKYLLDGVVSTIDVLNSLKPVNFVPHTSENAVKAGCSADILATVKAAVCKIDTKEYRIMIALGFCQLDKDGRFFGSTALSMRESQLHTLVH
ncbi:hypothetical protein [Diaphorobacter aerolatus]|uniref:Uncharacterized protein n=1 Tax=Diaphorobacter aerolatus TaxID=1288495 RepID=A0A7H0GL75_9BURK|nr:hypothetical protein [Diaphorobacter aerolatus]QNP49041.1 hypothetical protein H9K75_02455 [Diaphorobacter aerolatus]